MEYEIILDATQQIFKVDEMRLYLYTDDWFFLFTYANRIEKQTIQHSFQSRISIEWS
jgi:hypothetical protein